MTREQRVRYAAANYTFPWKLEAWRKCEALGISREEFEEGVALRTKEDDDYRAKRAYYGDPAYGSWPKESERKPAVSVQPIEHKEVL